MKAGWVSIPLIAVPTKLVAKAYKEAQRAGHADLIR